ncbi:hypothetical protein ACFSC3_09320 [Sphingomonas floccifaciens]|uniref:Uncharacterized protein n=1 Tax=Sphingomonas floccifaciens TaxID=1844115 RepID=A0ABW4NC80_9SPHN
MVTLPIHQPLTLSLTLSLGLAAATCVAGIFLILPATVLEDWTAASGVSAILPASDLPLGYSVRTALAMVAGVGAGVIMWLAAYLAFGEEGQVTLARRTADPAPPSTVDSDAPVPLLRRADAHPDAPARAPLSATRELGAPFLEVRDSGPIERALPLDLDAPLSAYDPAAIPTQPAAPVPVVPALQPRRSAPASVEGARIAAVELPRTDATIHALLDRLERGAGARRSEPSVRATSVAGTLDELRKLARR